MSALATELAKHVDDTGRLHRLLLLAPDRLRCLVCERSIDLRPALAAVPGSTSTSRGLPHPEQSCDQHPGEWRGTCGRCRSERIADEQRDVEHQATADVVARVAEARAALSRHEETPCDV